MDIQTVTQFFEQERISSISLHFAEFITQLNREDNPWLFLAAGLACHQVEKGNIALNLNDYAGKSYTLNENKRFTILSEMDWKAEIIGSSQIGSSGDRKPLILETMKNGSYLYLLKYWKYEREIIDYITDQLNRGDITISEDILSRSLSRLFPDQPDEIDWQKNAVEMSVQKRFSVITGGPGTGKTTTVVRLISALLDQPGSSPISIALVAPTGKAAARLKETLNQLLEQQPGLMNNGKVLIESATIHRLLGYVPGSPYFRHNQNSPLPFDIIILDEASMVDIALMAKIIRALRKESRFILLGDQHQLSSVEAGAMFGDICGNSDLSEASSGNKLADHIVKLQKSYRFDDTAGVGALSKAVNHGDGTGGFGVIQNNGEDELKWVSIADSNELNAMITDYVEKITLPYLRYTDVAASFEVFEKSIILCVVRKGVFGVELVNQLIERKLREARKTSAGSEYYPGKPVMVIQNNYELGLYNGDIGITLADHEDQHRLKVFFKSPDGGYRGITIGRLPAHETVYAMTVHKSQGSEFNQVNLILPNVESPILTREMIYTGVTRAKEKVAIWGTEKVFKYAIGQRVHRQSMIRNTFWGE